MNRIILALLINVLAAGAYAASATDNAFQNLSDEYISDLTNFSPVTATMIGDHSADGDIDQVDAAARAESLTLLREYRDALAALDREEMSRANQVDTELLLHEIESSIWSTEQLQEWAWNPIYYVEHLGWIDLQPVVPRLRADGTTSDVGSVSPGADSALSRAGPW